MRSLLKWLADRRAQEKAREAERLREWKAEEETWETAIKPLPLEEAKHRAQRLLDEPNKFYTVKAPPDNPTRLEPLAPELREFFTTYALVKGSTFVLDRSLIEPSQSPYTKEPHRFLSIGGDPDDMGELAVKPGEEGIYELADEVVTPDGRLVFVDDPDVSYPTVYHLLLYHDVHGLHY